MIDLIFVALGSLIRRWLADANDIEPAAKLLVALNRCVDIPGNVHKHDGWLSLLASSANDFLTTDSEAKATILQLIKCGRRRYPVFVDDPAAETIFGLSAPKTLLRLLPGSAARVALLRRVAQDFSDQRNLMIVQCKCDRPNSLWELASVESYPSKTKRTREESDDPPKERYIRWLNEHHTDLEYDGLHKDLDCVRLEAPIPCFYALNGFQWQNPPLSFFGPILARECDDSEWRLARGVTVRSILAFGDPDQAALYCITIHYWTAFSPNMTPITIGGPRYRQLPNIFVLRHVLWALDAQLPSRAMMFEHLDDGHSSQRILLSLKALQTASTLYVQLHNATLELRAAEQPLYQHHWIPLNAKNHRHYPFAGFTLNREEMFACISKFESGSFNFHPSAMNGVLAISSGNSIYVASCLLQDPSDRQSPHTIERVIGNLGKNGMALLVCPAVPQVRPLSDDVRLVHHHPFDGSERDSFGGTGLHISYTEWQLPIDVGSRGKRDVEAYYVEAAIGVFDRGQWVADVNILDVFKHRLSRLLPECAQHRDDERLTLMDETSKFVTIDSWEELLDSPTEIGVVRARGNWQARLAAAALSIQRGHETRIVPGVACWACCLALEKNSNPDTQTDDDAHAYGDAFGTLPWASDDEGSNSETDDVVAAEMKRNNKKFNGRGTGNRDAQIATKALNRNIVYVL